MPKFSKQWLDNFITDPELQQTFITSEVVRNALMLQCVFMASVYNDLLLYKHAFLNQTRPQDSGSKSALELSQENRPFKVGILGCGQIGTMILTKFLEAQGSFNQLRLMVSTRQPHLLRPFMVEFGISAEFNNERLFLECDLIFICV
jgi:NADP oxidoreductase coenzyme F420-dependent